MKIINVHYPDSSDSRFDVIEASRFILRPFLSSDLEALSQILGDWMVMRFVRRGVLTLAEIEEELEGYIGHWKKHKFGPWAVIDKVSGRVIGKCGIYLSERSYNPQLCYLLEQSHWGKGLGTEMAKITINQAFTKLEFPKIVAFVQHANHGSHNILTKLGMQHEREDLRYFGRAYSRYSLSREEYFSQRLLRL